MSVSSVPESVARESSNSKATSTRGLGVSKLGTGPTFGAGAGSGVGVRGSGHSSVCVPVCTRAYTVSASLAVSPMRLALLDSRNTLGDGMSVFSSSSVPRPSPKNNFAVSAALACTAVSAAIPAGATIFLTDAPKPRLSALCGKPHHTAVPGQQSVSLRHGPTLRMVCTVVRARGGFVA